MHLVTPPSSPFPISFLNRQVDIKLLSFKADSKIKVIKEVRSITSLGLKEVRAAHSSPARWHTCAPSPHPQPLITTHPHYALQAKELVEGAPCMMMQKVKREDAVKMVEKLKAETGAECELV